MKAIDTHVHFSTAEGRRKWGFYGDALETYFKFKMEIQTEEEMANVYRDIDTMAVLLPTDDETVSGIPPIPHEYVADMVKRFPDTFIGFAGVDPWKGKAAIDELERAVKELGLRGAKFQQGGTGLFSERPPILSSVGKMRGIGYPDPVSLRDHGAWRGHARGAWGSNSNTWTPCPLTTWRPTFPA